MTHNFPQVTPQLFGETPRVDFLGESAAIGSNRTLLRAILRTGLTYSNHTTEMPGCL